MKKIPAGFTIWNISSVQVGDRHYLPICQTIRPDDKNCFEVNTQTLKAIELTAEETAICGKAASAGIDSVKKAKRTLSRKAKTAYMRENQRRAAAALPILERITA